MCYSVGLFFVGILIVVIGQKNLQHKHHHDKLYRVIYLIFKGHLCDPKTGRKLLFGTKYSQMEFGVSQEDDCLKKEFQDLVILAALRILEFETPCTFEYPSCTKENH